MCYVVIFSNCRKFHGFEFDDTFFAFYCCLIRSRFVHLEVRRLKFVVIFPSLAICITFWFIIIPLLFVYLSTQLFSCFLHLRGKFISWVATIMAYLHIFSTTKRFPLDYIYSLSVLEDPFSPRILTGTCNSYQETIKFTPG